MTEIAPTHAIVDGDAFKYAAAYVGEKRSIVATHKTEGWSEEAKSRTAFWGHWKKRQGGWLAEANKNRTSPWHPDEFEIEDISTPEPLANVLHTAKSLVDGILEASNAETYEFYMGKGDSFRVELSTLLKYKGNRDDLVKPYHLDDVTEYLAKRYKAEFITGIEADDMVNIRCYREPNHFAIGEDKDYWGCPINFFDINRQERGIVNCNKLGHLFLDKKKEVRGEGRIHFYWQMISQDDVDNYKANCFSETEFGKMGAFYALENCKTDKECFQVMVDTFKMLYPEKQVVKGWRGDDIEIDWMYVMQEMFQMAHMKRSVDEEPKLIKPILDKMGVIY